MSCLKLYWPLVRTQALSLYRPEEASDADWPEDRSKAETVCDESPVILAFPRLRRRAGIGQADLLSRARQLHQNRCCPICNRAAVVPVNAEPALMTRNHMPIPGGGDLLGFECDACGHAWEVE